MRLKRIEFAIIALTLAFACFLGGYFTGRRSAVNIISVAPQQTQTQTSQGSQSSTGTEAENGGENRPNQSEGEIGGNSDSANNQQETPATSGSDQISTNGAIGLPRESDGKININTATRGELMDLSGIGEVLAGRIIDYRNQHGRFERIEDIMRVTGIGERRFEAIKDRITVG